MQVTNIRYSWTEHPFPPCSDIVMSNVKDSRVFSLFKTKRMARKKIDCNTYVAPIWNTVYTKQKSIKVSKF